MTRIVCCCGLRIPQSSIVVVGVVDIFVLFVSSTVGFVDVVSVEDYGSIG